MDPKPRSSTWDESQVAAEDSPATADRFLPRPPRLGRPRLPFPAGRCRRRSGGANRHPIRPECRLSKSAETILV
ncbi:unnamed protein product [Nesidiocoris tenuis]|uniref:Uncharacterized protein n=1 Tax=Nesidiocoris tenuis TaxID=355587 RepID=A0A6H5GN23_9HEMI|nr:unnamed protein product [Nesidiocoris tenuis]